MKIINKIYKKILNISRKIHTPIRRKEIRRWRIDNGDKTLRLNYNLNTNSIVFDIGGYKGEWANDIFSKYNCNIYIFEPIPGFANNLTKQFSNNNKINVQEFGLGEKNERKKMSLDDDKSSSCRKNTKKYTKTKIVDIIDFIDQNNINHIDLMKINIEGDEYCLLERLIEKKYINKISNLQIQFHNFIPNYKKRMKNIQAKLKITHKPTYQYTLVWENWKKI